MPVFVWKLLFGLRLHAEILCTYILRCRLTAWFDTTGIPLLLIIQISHGSRSRCGDRVQVVRLNLQDVGLLPTPSVEDIMRWLGAHQSLSSSERAHPQQN